MISTCTEVVGAADSSWKVTPWMAPVTVFDPLVTGMLSTVNWASTPVWPTLSRLTVALPLPVSVSAPEMVKFPAEPLVLLTMVSSAPDEPFTTLAVTPASAELIVVARSVKDSPPELAEMVCVVPPPSP